MPIEVSVRTHPLCILLTVVVLAATSIACTPSADDDTATTDSGEDSSSGAGSGVGPVSDATGSGATGSDTGGPSGGTDSGPDGSTGSATGPDGSTGSATATGSDTTQADASDEGAVVSPVRVVVLGTSIAAAKNLEDPMYGGAPGNKGWVTQYREYLETTLPGSSVVDLAVASTTTFEAMPTGTVNPAGYPAPDPSHNITAAIAEDPDVVIVSYHLASGAPTSQIISNLLAIEAAASAAGVPIWVSTPTPRLATDTQMQLVQVPEAHDAIVAEFGDQSLDFTTPMIGPDGYGDPAFVLSDGQHPNQTGHTILFDVVSAAGIPEALPGL